MKYLLMIYSNPLTWGHPIYLRTAEALAMDEPERAALLDSGGALIREIVESGELVTSGALADPMTSRTVRVRDGEVLATDGPFVETKEQFAGYFVLDCATPERAEEIAGRFPDARFAAVELRPLMTGGGDDA